MPQNASPKWRAVDLRGSGRPRVFRLSAARIALGYAIIATLWIIFSDLIFGRLELSPSAQTVKGTAFVAVTAYLLYFTIRRLIDAVQQTSRERDETEKLYRTVVEASEQGICLLDVLGKITFLNKRLAALMGSSVEELLGRRLEDLVAEPEIVVDLSPDKKPAKTQECRLRTSQKTAWVLATSTPLFDAEGGFCGTLAMLLDVTERKHLETELRQSQKMEALGTFAGGIAHDFNNLLSIISGYGSLLENAAPRDGQQRTAAREILSACTRGALLVRQLLAFSRKQAVVSQVINVQDLVGRFCEVLPRIVGEHIAVRVHSDMSTGFVEIGAGQIEQILLNLASNARDAMPQGGSLTVATSVVDVPDNTARVHGVNAGSYVSIGVSDTGVGISPEVRNHIFEPFFTTKPVGKGTGLGLSTVYGITAQHGGFLTCESTVGEGTTFTVYLSAAEPPRVSGETRVPVSSKVSGTETILLVEDEPALRVLTKHILSSNGYRVIEASNGIEAVELAGDAKEKIDLLLTDVMMPGMNGVELARRFSRLLPNAKIAFMSGYDELPERFDQNAAIIQKPITPDTLLAELRTILEGGRAAAS